MGFCTQCGANIADGQMFCSTCGKPVGQNAQRQNGQGQQFTDKIQQLNDTADYTAEFDPQDVSANKGMGVLAYLGILFLIPLLAAPNSRFARFHTSQGLTLFIVGLGCSVITFLLNLIKVPRIGFWGYVYSTPWYISLISSLLGIAVLVLIIIGIVNAVQGKAKELPLIGKFKLIK